MLYAFNLYYYYCVEARDINFSFGELPSLGVPKACGLFVFEVGFSLEIISSVDDIENYLLPETKGLGLSSLLEPSLSFSFIISYPISIVGTLSRIFNALS